MRLSDFSQHGRTWTRQHVEAMGSEYTSRAWDDTFAGGWGYFVGEATGDVPRTGIF